MSAFMTSSSSMTWEIMSMFQLTTVIRVVRRRRICAWPGLCRLPINIR